MCSKRVRFDSHREFFFSALLSLFMKQRTYKIPNNPAGAELDCFSHRTQNDGAVPFKNTCVWLKGLSSDLKKNPSLKRVRLSICFTGEKPNG